MSDERAPLLSGKQDEKAMRAMSLQDFLLLAAMFLNSFFANSVVSLLAPFLPHHIVQLGARTSYVGILLSAYPLSVFFSLPICNYCCRKIGRNRVLYAGALLQAVAAIVFGMGETVASILVPEGKKGHTLCILVVYFVTRILQGLGAAGANLALTATVADRFKDSLGKLMGVNETIIGLGFTLGPPMGSTLYALGGFGMPFIVLGCILLGLVFLFPFVVPSSCVSKGKGTKNKGNSVLGEEAEELALLGGEDKPLKTNISGQISVANVLSVGIVLPAICVALGVATFSYQEVFLAPYEVEVLGLSISAVGAMFMPSSGFYSILGPISGIIVDKGGSWGMVVGGHIVAGIANILLGVKSLPRLLGALLGGKEKTAAWIIQIGCLSVFGGAQAFILIPPLSIMQRTLGIDGEEATEVIVSIFFGMQMLGATIGSLSGGFMEDYLGYYVSLYVLGAVNCGFALIAAVIWKVVVERRKTSSNVAEVKIDSSVGDRGAETADSNIRRDQPSSPKVFHRRMSNPQSITIKSAPANNEQQQSNSGSSSFRATNLLAMSGVSARSPQIFSHTLTSSARMPFSYSRGSLYSYQSLQDFDEEEGS